MLTAQEPSPSGTAGVRPPRPGTEGLPAMDTMRQSWVMLRPTILLVEDDDDLREFMSQLLQYEGYRTLEAGSARQALAAASTEIVDAVLLDVVLPDGSGLTVCRALREDRVLCHVPVIMVTALHEMSDEVEGIRAGAVGYLTKPVRPRELIARLQDVI